MPTGVNCPLCGAPMDTALMVHFADQKNGCTFIEVHYMCPDHETSTPFKVIRYDVSEVKSHIMPQHATEEDLWVFDDGDLCETIISIPTHHVMDAVRSQLAQSGITTAIAAASADMIGKEQQRRMACESEEPYTVKEPVVAKPIKRDDHNYIA